MKFYKAILKLVKFNFGSIKFLYPLEKISLFELIFILNFLDPSKIIIFDNLGIVENNLI